MNREERCQAILDSRPLNLGNSFDLPILHSILILLNNVDMIGRREVPKKNLPICVYHQ